MTDRDPRAYSAAHASDYPALQLDELGRLVRSPAIEKLVLASREVLARAACGFSSGDYLGVAPLREALAEVDVEGRALALGSTSRISWVSPAPLGECTWCVAIMSHDPARHFRGCPLREEKAQPLANKELPPNVDHGLETPKPGGEPGSDVVSECLAPEPSVTSVEEK